MSLCSLHHHKVKVKRLKVGLCLVLYSFARPSGPSKALKLGAKGKEVDNFVDKLKSEGETIMPTSGKRGSDASKALPPPVNVER